MVYKLALALTLLAPSIRAEESSIVLYQVGSKGKYCLSLTRDESGCVSGEDKAGNSINIMDVTRGKNVRFENLSDAPHDMRITGANKENLPAQGPGAAPVDKLMAKEDRDKQKITCSFHGDQLGVGYRVLDDSANAKAGGKAEGHKEPGVGGGNRPTPGEGGGEMATSSTTGPIDPARPIRNTGLADVAKEVLAKGRPDEVKQLLNARPELMGDLKEVRPLLAEELAKGTLDPESVEPGALDQEETLKAFAEGRQLVLDANGNPVLAEDNSGSGSNGGIENRDARSKGRTGGAIPRSADTALDRSQELTADLHRASPADLTFSRGRGVAGKTVTRDLNSVSALELGTEKRSRGWTRLADAEFGTRMGKLLALLIVLGVTGRGFFLVLFARRRKNETKG